LVGILLLAEIDVYRIARSPFSSGVVLHLLYECTLPNMRLKLTAPVLEGAIAFVNVLVWRRSLGAIR